MTLIIVIGAIVLIVLFLISLYNRLVSLRNNRENAFANIDVQLQQRHDLVPQLVNTVKGYAAHEKSVLEAVTNARASAMSANSINDKIAAEQALDKAMLNLKVAMEAYPQLKANENFMKLQAELSDIENKLAAVRRYFNSSTRELNTAIESFPSNIVAGMFGFSRQPMFEVSAEQRSEVSKAPEVNF